MALGSVAAVSGGVGVGEGDTMGPTIMNLRILLAPLVSTFSFATSFTASAFVGTGGIAKLVQKVEGDSRRWGLVVVVGWTGSGYAG